MERAYSMGCNPDRVRQLFEAELAQGRDIFCIIFSSECSGSYGTACMVAQELMEEQECRICVVDSLNGSAAAGLMVYLAHGRLNAVSGAVGTVLNIKPILHFEAGKIVPFVKCRGKNNARHTILETVKKRKLDKHLVAVVHTDNLEEAKEFAAEVERELEVKVVYINEVNLTIGTHTGPDALGLAFCELP